MTPTGFEGKRASAPTCTPVVNDSELFGSEEVPSAPDTPLLTIVGPAVPPEDAVAEALDEAKAAWLAKGDKEELQKRLLELLLLIHGG